jgi:hypothetical protein
MATQRALNRLQTLLELNRRATAQAQGLAATFSVAIQEIQAVKNDLDIEWRDEVLAEETTGDETEFQLLHVPVRPDSLQVYVNGSPVSIEADVDWDAGVIVPTQAVPTGKRIAADYTQLGLKSQIIELLNAIPSVSMEDITDQIQVYSTAITWLNQNFPT